MPDAPEPQGSLEPKASPDELIIDLDQWNDFQTLLATLKVSFEHDPDEDRDEDLGLIRLGEIKESETGTLIDLDDLLAELRRRYAAGHPDTDPKLGKNRFVESLIGSGHKIMAGSDEPTVPEGVIPERGHTGAGRGVRIGMVDTPITESAQGELGVLTGRSFADGGQTPIPYRAGHGTFVASLIKRQAPAAELHLEGISDPKTGRANSWQAARAMMRLVKDHHIHILNLSNGCYAATGAPFVIRRAIEKLSGQVLIVAAAGNHGGIVEWFRGRTEESEFYPAAMQHVIGVGAHGEGGKIPEWSPKLPWITCTAPGVDVVAEFLSGPVIFDGKDERQFHGLARWSGTSFATATVSGAIAAQMVSEEAAEKGLPPQLTPREAFIQLSGSGGIVRKFKPGG